MSEVSLKAVAYVEHENLLKKVDEMLSTKTFIE